MLIMFGEWRCRILEAFVAMKSEITMTERIIIKKKKKLLEIGSKMGWKDLWLGSAQFETEDYINSDHSEFTYAKWPGGIPLIKLLSRLKKTKKKTTK